MRKLSETSPDPRPSRFAIRRMGAEDLEPVMAIARASFHHPWSVELFRRELTHDWSTILLALEPPADGAAEAILGFAIFWLVHDEIHVLNVAVDPLHRRAGIARALIAETVERGRKLKCNIATLEARRSNAAALELYKSFGFRQVGVRPNYYVDEGEDAIVMVLDL